jgi:hypothetical protein
VRGYVNLNKLFTDLIFNSPWYFILFCFATAFSFSLILYFRNSKNREGPKRVLFLLSGFRFLIVFLGSLLLLNVLLKNTIRESQQPLIILAVDNSASMMLRSDSSNFKTEFLKLRENLKGSVADKFELRQLLFGVTSAATDAEPNFNEKETDIDGLLQTVENNYANENVGAIIIISDGIYNKGSNPLNSATTIQYPIYTIATGDTTEINDVAIQKINHNDFAYLGNVFPVQVAVNAKKYSGKEITASLFEGKIKKAEQQLKINSANFFSSLTFTLNAESGGVHKYTVQLSVLEGETNISNNLRSFAIDVIDQRAKILITSPIPHPDIAAIKEALQNNSAFETDVHIASEKHPGLKAYSLVIIHGIVGSQTSLLDECVAANIPYWIVNPISPENIPGVKITASNNRYNDAEPVASKSFGLFTITQELQKMINDYPAVKTFFGNYNVSPGANSLLVQKIGVVETENPLFLFSEINNHKSAVFLGEGLWKWKLRNYAEKKNTDAFNELINKTAQYLSIKSDKSFFRVSAPKIVDENEQINFTAEVYNKTYELINDADVLMTLNSIDKKQFNYTFSKTANAYKLNIGFLPAGEYNYQAKVKVGNDVLTKSGTLVVKEIIAEKLNTVADHRLLFQLASRTGGKFYNWKNANEVSKDLTQNELIKPITFSATHTSPLIEYSFLLFLILVLLTIEWIIRKRFLSI